MPLITHTVSVTFEALQFQHSFRRYQSMMLTEIENQSTDSKLHLVAPPGSGKTIVGLELIRRFDRPAVVFAPTTTIQNQWQEKLAMFGDQTIAAQLSSTDADSEASISFFTYQLISTPSEASEQLRRMAQKAWQDELVNSRVSATPQEATQRLQTLKANNPNAYRHELGTRTTNLRRAMLTGSNVDPSSLLHPNAKALVDRLVARGVGTVVLDECHHLLSYWAVILRYLISRLDNPKVIGLTATLPSPEDDDEYENYSSLLGDVDFEVPTPAVVKEGDLAPYRDLVYSVRPTERERTFLKNIDFEFAQAVSDTTSSPAFKGWVSSLLPLPGADETNRWNAFLNEGLFATAVLRYARGEHLVATEVPLPIESEAPIELEDWLLLLSAYGLDVLKPSQDSADHELLKELRHTLGGFGLTLTERGIRASRSPGDLAITFSAAKDEGTATVLRAEAAAMGERLRAVVLTDFERASSAISSVSETVGNDAGSARRVFGHLLADPECAALSPVLMTGKNLLVPEKKVSAIISRCRELTTEPIQVIPTDIVSSVEISGWPSKSYVPVITQLFAEGLVKILVGTRGILGEGWDCVALNTVIDLTSVTTATGVQQLRGRSLRLDPSWPTKLAHNWDIICVDPSFPKGSGDLDRLVKKHNRFWGIVTEGGPLSAIPSGSITKGLSHVDVTLDKEIHGLTPPPSGWRHANYDSSNQRALDATHSRGDDRALWQIGNNYKNVSWHGTQMSSEGFQMPTVYSLRKTLAQLELAFMGTVGTIGVAAVETARAGVTVFLGAAGLAFVASVVVLIRTARKMCSPNAPDAILKDIGRAVLYSLQEIGAVSKSMNESSIEVSNAETDAGGTYTVGLLGALDADQLAFGVAFREVLAPVVNQKYLVERTDRRLPQLRLMPMWLALRHLFSRPSGPAYFPVPTALAGQKENATIYANNWARYVGGGKLVFSRTDEGRAILLQARAETRPKAHERAFTRWS